MGWISRLKLTESSARLCGVASEKAATAIAEEKIRTI
jgi:hypothetical protein